MHIVHCSDTGYWRVDGERRLNYKVWFACVMPEDSKKDVDVTDECPTLTQQVPNANYAWISFTNIKDDIEYQISLLIEGRVDTCCGMFVGFLSQLFDRTKMTKASSENYHEWAAKLGKTPQELHMLILNSLLFSEPDDCLETI